MINEIKVVFHNNFKDGTDITASFGVAIRYYKFPLYEAFDNAVHQLFGIAKRENKNSLAISLKKNSGSHSQFVIREYSKNNKDNSNGIDEILNSMIKNRIEHEFINSISTKIWASKTLFLKALGEKRLEIKNNKKDNILKNDTIQNLFNNIFNHEIHHGYKHSIELSKELLIEISKLYFEKKEVVGDNSSEKLEDILIEFDSMLRFVKFFSEESGDEE